MLNRHHLCPQGKSPGGDPEVRGQSQGGGVGAEIGKHKGGECTDKGAGPSVRTPLRNSHLS